MTVEAVDFAPNDPIFAYLQSAGGMVEIETLRLDSPAVDALKQAGVKIAVPLLSQGELVGLLNLGAHLGEQDYSTDDHRLLRDLASQVAPAVRVAQLVRQQEADTRERQRFEQELEVARVRSFPRRCLSCQAGRSQATTSRPARWAAISTIFSLCPTTSWG